MKFAVDSDLLLRLFCSPDFMATLSHQFPFDPTYGYTLESLQTISAPKQPSDFEAFWRARRERALAVDPNPRLEAPGIPTPDGWVGNTVRYTSTDGLELACRLLVPDGKTPQRALIYGHGYGTKEDEPFPEFLPPDAILLFPHARGLGMSKVDGISSNPYWHVLNGINSRDNYVLGGCVEDLWLAVSALLKLFPEVEGRVGYLGISFGGGIGVLATPWEPRINRVHFNVPSFGNHPLRLTMRTHGSGESVRNYARKHGSEKLIETLSYFDAAVAARYLNLPVHCALALFDPFVTPAGQFSIYNAIPGEKVLFILEAGHFEYANQAAKEQALRDELKNFFWDQ